MIFGIGTDLVAISRMTDMHARHGARLAQRVLAPEEWNDYAATRDKDRFLAKRFAAKEAFAKAVGTGLRTPVNLTSIIIRHDPQGRPLLDFADELKVWLRERHVMHTHLSISDEHTHALAFVVVEG